MAKFEVTAPGFIFDRLRKVGEIIDISADFLKEFKIKNKKDFKASWLEPVIELPKSTPTMTA